MPFDGLRSEAPAFFAALARDNTKSFFESRRGVYEDRVRRPDRSPYKTFIGALEPGPAAVGRYVMVDGRGLLVATGAPMLAPDQLVRYRAAVDDDGAGRELAALVDGLRRSGHRVKPGRHDPLRTAPRGYPRDHPRIELLRWKGVEVPTRLGTPAWLETAQAPERIVSTWQGAADLDAWLDRHVGASELSPEDLWAKGRRA